MKPHLSRLTLAALAVAGCLLATGPSRAEKFSDARIRFELNASAGDGGIQINVDATGWNRLEVFDPSGQKIFDVFGSHSVGATGVTELFFESAEPSFEDLPLDQLLIRFPAGTYSFEGVTADGARRLAGSATLSHRLPAGPRIVAPSEGSTLSASAPLVIDWDPVTQRFPGSTLPVTIAGYEVIVEQDKPQPALPRSFDITLPASVTRVTVPPQFLRTNTDYKFEILAIEQGGNQTISEGSFKTAP